MVLIFEFKKLKIGFLMKRLKKMKKQTRKYKNIKIINLNNYTNVFCQKDIL